ncbi:CPBP family intramembrane glutamic endopeptidase [Aliikangiella marina]|uniref:CPBP family intramembrane glutamic endopeptidase n=1 Tax=Aliikangiella marina TaxID=1712262 RepID=UPI00163DAEC7|nr:CPBP family intramembrane glutamic endopeptidase [Aliikangiella marina]
MAEETFFRGFIQQRLYYLFEKDSLWHKTIPLIVASLLFGLVHFAGGIGYVVASTVAGIGYGLAYQITQRIEVAILSHTLLNLVHLVLFTYPFSMNDV